MHGSRVTHGKRGKRGSVAALALVAALSSMTPVAADERIISIDPVITETIYALERDELLVGRDESSTYPAECESLPAVGFPFQLNAEGLLSLKPTRVLGGVRSGPEGVLETVRATGIAVDILDSPSTPDVAIARILHVAEIVDAKENGDRIVASIRADLAELDARIAEHRPSLKVAALYLRGTRTMFLMGRNSAMVTLAGLAGATPALPALDAAVPLSSEALVASAPDVLLLMQHGWDSVGGEEGVLKLPGVALTPAGRHRHFVVMDDLLVGALGPRFGEAGLELHSRLAALEATTDTAEGTR